MILKRIIDRLQKPKARFMPEPAPLPRIGVPRLQELKPHHLDWLRANVKGFHDLESATHAPCGVPAKIPHDVQSAAVS